MENLPVSSQIVSHKTNAKSQNVQQPASNVDQANGASPADASAENSVPDTFGKILAKQVAMAVPGKDEPIDAVLKGKAKDTDNLVEDATTTGNQVLFLDPNALPAQKFLASNASPVAVAKSVFAEGVPSAMSAISGKELPVNNGKPVDIATALHNQPVSDLPEQSDAKTGVQAFDLLLAEKQTVQKDTSGQSNLAALQLPATAIVSPDKNTAANQAALTVPQRVGSESWGSGLGDKVVWMVGNQTRGAEIHLNPPALGPLEVRVNITDGQANLSFMSSHASVREAIEAATPRLREMLSDTGISMGSVSVNVGSFSQQQPQQQQTFSHEQATSSNQWLAASGEAADTSTRSFTTFVQPSRGRGMVDYFA